jgi:hypothetical protein
MNQPAYMTQTTKPKHLYVESVWGAEDAYVIEAQVRTFYKGEHLRYFQLAHPTQGYFTKAQAERLYSKIIALGGLITLTHWEEGQADEKICKPKWEAFRASQDAAQAA